MTLMYQPTVGRAACSPAPPETASAIASTSRRPSSSYVTTISGFVVPVSMATAWWRSATRPSTSEGRKMDIANAMFGRASTRAMPARTSSSVARRRSPVRPSTMFGQSEPGPNQAVSPPHAIAGRPDRSCRVSDFGATASASATSRAGMRTRSASSTCAPAAARRRRASGWSTRTPVRSRIEHAADWIRAQPSSDRRFQRPAPGVIAAGPDRSLGARWRNVGHGTSLGARVPGRAASPPVRNGPFLRGPAERTTSWTSARDRSPTDPPGSPRDTRSTSIRAEQGSESMPRRIPRTYAAVIVLAVVAQRLDLTTFAAAVARVGIGAETDPMAQTLYAWNESHRSPRPGNGDHRDHPAGPGAGRAALP